MRAAINPKVERFRIREGALRSTSTYGNNGAFAIPHPSGVMLYCIASDGKDWDHVSVQALDKGSGRIPTWSEMQHIKELFFEDEELVIEFHVPKSKHLNLHPNVLHLWRPQRATVPLPPSQMVAPKNLEEWEKVIAGKTLF